MKSISSLPPNSGGKRLQLKQFIRCGGHPQSGGNTPLIQWVSLQQLLGSKPAFKSTLPLINVGGILSTQPLITWGEITNKI